MTLSKKTNGNFCLNMFAQVNKTVGIVADCVLWLKYMGYNTYQSSMTLSKITNGNFCLNMYAQVDKTVGIVADCIRWLKYKGLQYLSVKHDTFKKD